MMDSAEFRNRKANSEGLRGIQRKMPKMTSVLLA
jgi:hypothetical protein